MERGGLVNIMADRCRVGLYVGVTADLVRRVYQHRNGEGSQHVAEYGKTRSPINGQFADKAGRFC